MKYFIPLILLMCINDVISWPIRIMNVGNRQRQCYRWLVSIRHYSANVDTNLQSISFQNNSISKHKFSVAPMMEYTDRHQRYLTRLMTKEAVLYTEMVTANALVRTEDSNKFLEADMDIENPLVLQLGGSDVAYMRNAARIAYNAGYREMNINAGCPSEKVAGAGCFGAALMFEPDLVGQLALAISDITGQPTTIKCRIGVDDRDSYEELTAFIQKVHDIGKVNHFIIHARKAVLGAKFSPDYNRKVPPLKYEFVHRLVQDFPHISFTLNGGITTYEEINQQLKYGIAGVMVGRSVVNNPYYWRHIDSKIYNSSSETTVLSRREIINEYAKYATIIEKKDGKKARRALIKPILNLFVGEHNGRVYRCLIDELLQNKDMSAASVLLKASDCLSDSILDFKDNEMLCSST